jgi:ankyrin repeat protein
MCMCVCVCVCVCVCGSVYVYLLAGLVCGEQIALALFSTKNIDVNVKNADEASALVYLVRFYPAEDERRELYRTVFEHFLASGVDVSNKNKYGETALHLV